VLGRVLLAAAIVLGMPAWAPATPAAPAWTLHYGFGTGLYGGTNFDVDASGRFDLVTTSVHSPRSERSGRLAPAALQTFAQLVGTARTSAWSDAYRSSSACYEHFPSLALTRAEVNGARTARVTWSCGLIGLPADLRALIFALRAQIMTITRDAWVDGKSTTDTSHDAAHEALELVTVDRSRAVSIAADGTIVGRRRTIVAPYPVADCPVRALGTVDAATMVKLHALETPTAEVYFATTRETREVFEKAMVDCAAPAGFGYADPEYAVPPGTRWVLKVIRAVDSDVVTLVIDNAGRSFVRRKNAQPARGSLGGGALRSLERLIATAHDDHWPRNVDLTDACEQLVQITHVAADGVRTNGPQIDGPCDGTGAPADAAALFRYVGERLVPELTRPR
jgi:hypothetical protein